MSEFLLLEAETSDDEEKRLTQLIRVEDNLLSESDTSQTRVFGATSSDEESFDGEYESDFIDDTTPQSTPEKTKFHLSLTDVLPFGLPNRIATQLPYTSTLWNFVNKADEKVIENIKKTTMPRVKTVVTKGKAPTKFQERVEAEMTSLNPSAEEKVDQFIEAKLKKKLQEKQKTDKKAEAMEILAERGRIRRR